MRTLVTGVLGQDGSYLAEQLAEDGHEVFGVVRSADDERRARLLSRVPRARLLDGDLTDYSGMHALLRQVRPDAVFNLAAVTTPGESLSPSWDSPVTKTTGLAVFQLASAVSSVVPEARLVHASSSAVCDPVRFGAYGLAKQFAHNALLIYRRTGLHATNAVLFSHTSARQSHRFLIRRLVRAVVDLTRGLPVDLEVTNLANRRDWGWAADYARAVMLLADAEPDDYYVRTGERHSVEGVIHTACRVLDADPERVLARWPNASRVEDYPDVNPITHRPSPPGWRPSVTFEQLIRKLVEDELK